MIDQTILGAVSAAGRLLRGVVRDHVEDNRFVVRVAGGSEEWLIIADLLVTGGVPLVLAHGDIVLCWIDSDDRDRGVILGRVGASAQPEPEPMIADVLVLEAKQSLTLRVGDGSITIREDGKILIKGKDLVSHAERLNRIKGGSVSIN
jgi:hypothetical protein